MEKIIVHEQQPISLHRELGIMFGFFAACILTVALYYIFWQMSQRRAAARDEARRKDLRARGFHHERGGYHDKALHRYASRDPIAQTQGLTLEFLTAPDQFKTMVTNNNNDNNKNDNDDNNNNSNNNNSNNNDNNNNRADAGGNAQYDEVEISSTTGDKRNNNDNYMMGNNGEESRSQSSAAAGAGAGAGLRIDSPEYIHRHDDEVQLISPA